jgi:FkbM family methyltransferase
MSEKKICYLTQCAGCIPPNYTCFRSRDIILLSYKQNTPDTDIFFPNSTWTAGRNKLFELAIQKEYDYYVFLDGDLNIDESLLKQFETILNKIDYPIIVPNMWNYNTRISSYKIKYNRKGIQNNLFKAQSVDWFDGAMNAFHKNSIRKLLPYNVRYDSTSWWYSQLCLILKSNFLFKNQIVQINNINIINNSHSNYPRDMNNTSEVVDKYIKENSMEKLEMSKAIEIYLDTNQMKIEYLSGHKKIINIVFKLLNKYKEINYIDVGVANGMMFKEMINQGFKINNIKSVGIDPLLYIYNKNKSNYLSNYNVLLECAITIKDNEELNFYVQKNRACSSLNEINHEYISNTIGGDCFYLPKTTNGTNIITTQKKIKVISRTMSSIIKELKLNDEIIHFLKVDAQGQDLNVIKSLDKYLKNVLFIMIETTMPHIKNGTLYKNSTTYTQDLEFLKNNNFEVVCVEKLLESDADALFYNKSLIKQSLETSFK